MTLQELQHIILIISNQVHVRYWAHFNHPVESPWLMAIEIADFKEFPGLEEKGFRWNPLDKRYYIERKGDV